MYKSCINLEWGCPNRTNTPGQPSFIWHIAHPWLMGRVPMKFHEDRCKGYQAVMRMKPFHLTHALWPWPLTFDLLTLKSTGPILDSWGVWLLSFLRIGVKGKQLCTWNHFYLTMHLQTDRQTAGWTGWFQYTPPLNSLWGGGGIINQSSNHWSQCSAPSPQKLINF